ncbi:MAG: Rrf2 family transcriptional regulator [Myxococcota bacterium]
MSFGTGLHVMLALAYNPGVRMPSATLAESVGANPVTVRRVIADLAAAGLVDTQTGPGGGATLARSARRITVANIHEAFGEPAFIEGHHKDPVGKCEVSVCMPRVIDRLNHAVAKKAAPVLRGTTLQALVDEEIRS